MHLWWVSVNNTFDFRRKSGLVVLSFKLSEMFLVYACIEVFHKVEMLFFVCVWSCCEAFECFLLSSLYAFSPVIPNLLCERGICYFVFVIFVHFQHSKRNIWSICWWVVIWSGSAWAHFWCLSWRDHAVWWVITEFINSFGIEI